MEFLSVNARVAVELVFFDYVMSKPTEFDPHISSAGLPVHEVPTIRVFGSTLCGQQVCLHIHGYLPYFYLPVPDNVDSTALASRVHRTLEIVARKYLRWKKKLRKRNRPDRTKDYKTSKDKSSNTPGHTPSSAYTSRQTTSDSNVEPSVFSYKSCSTRSRMLSQSAQRINFLRRRKAEHSAHIHRVDVVEHVNFYGYHTKPRKFLKVYHYNPVLTKYLAGYTFHTGIGKHKLQPYEVHISYLMHFLSDYNVRGMDYLFLSSAIKMRGPLPLHPRCLIQSHPLWQRVMDESRRWPIYGQYMFLKPIVRDSPSVFLSKHVKRSTCELEIDAHVATILNVVELNDDLIHGTQEFTQGSFAVGGYMCYTNRFFQKWDEQCVGLHKASISSFTSCDNDTMSFVSADTLRPFYKYLYKNAQQLDKLKIEVASSTLKQLLSKLDKNANQSLGEAKEKSDIIETITFDPSILHTMEDHAYGEMDAQLYAYRYIIPPPKIDDCANATVDGCVDVESSNSVGASSTLITCSDALNNKPSAGAPGEVASIKSDIPSHDDVKDGNVSIDASTPSGIIPDVDNFESGIVIDVITDIELNHIHPDPQRHAIHAVVYTLRDHRLQPNFDKIGIPYADVQGAIVLDPNGGYVNFPKQVNIPEYKKWALIQRHDPNFNDIERSIYSGKYTDVSFVSSEIQLLECLRNLILRFDPNIIYGYDLARSSLGYINQRASFLGMVVFIESISRIAPRVRGHASKSTTSVTDTSTLLTHQHSKLKKNHLKENTIQPLLCVGRLIFDLMDVALRELNLSELSLENIVYNQFGYIMPSYHMNTIHMWLTTKVCLSRDLSEVNKAAAKEGATSCANLARSVDAESDMPYLRTSVPFNGVLCSKGNAMDCIISPHVFRCIRHALLRNYAVIATFDKLMYLQKYITFSRLYGIDLKSTIVRGSQYHVESILVRFTKSFKYILPSPTERQVHEQRPSAAIPIVMQPISGLHVAPVAVLDFQSLYSCIAIAYNICYSTCLGLLSEHQSKSNTVKLGVMTYHPENGVFRDILSKSIDTNVFNERSIGAHIMPNGVMFVDKHIREGILPMMLKSVLYSRRRIKAALSRDAVDDMTMQQWHHEQHGLKMISNLSVGLTASGFSGRMPCSDLAESVVSIARALILFCTELVHDNFDAQVIYGDTDSIFIKFPGKTVAEAQELAHIIADTINSAIPEPIKILPHKVYCPCLLVSKKRYVGLLHANGKVIFDDKGIETMRVSECHATRSILKTSLESIFKTLTFDKAYDEILRIFRSVGSVYTPQDFIIYRQIRLGTYREDITGKMNTLPAAAIVAKYKMHKHYGNRILENEYIPHVFSLSRVDESGGIKESAVFPNEISGIFKATDYVKEIGHRTLPQNSVAHILEQIRRAQPLRGIDVAYYLKKQVLPPLKRMLQPLDLDSNFSITQEVFKKLAAMPTTLGERVDRTTRPNSRTEDIWVYTGVRTRCVGCGTPCKVKLGKSPSDEGDQYPNDDTCQDAADALQHGSVCNAPPQDTTLSFDHTSGMKHQVIICCECKRHPKQTLLTVINELHGLEATISAIHNICLNCTGSPVGSASCQNAWHCEVYFKRISYKKAFSRALKEYRGILTLAYTE